jgi:hypothetical protein
MDGAMGKAGTTAWAMIQLAIPLIPFTLAMALITTGKSEGIAAGAAIAVFCVYRTVRVILVWRAAMVQDR